MSKSSKKSLVQKHNSWERLWFLQRRVKELERVRMPTIKQRKLQKRYELEMIKLFVNIIP